MQSAKPKIIVLFITLLAAVGMVFSIAALKDSYYWRGIFWNQEWDYLKTRTSFSLFSRNVKISTPSEDTQTDSVPILLYHGVMSDPDWKPDEVNVSLKDFTDQMFALKKSGYRTITLEDYLAFTKGEKTLPEKSFLLTFDDGRSDSYYPADPILRALDYTAVMFAITGRSLEENEKSNSFHLSREELRRMAQSERWELASHTRNGHNEEIIGPNGEKGHFLSDKLWIESEKRNETEDEFTRRIASDLLDSKADLEKIPGVRISAFAFPFGDFGQASQNFPESENIVLPLVRSIYPLSFYQMENGEFPENWAEDDFLAKRIKVGSEISAENLLEILDNSRRKPAVYEDNFSNDNGWLRGWGELAIKNNSMVIGGSRPGDSASAFLDGTYLWEDYYAEAKARIKKTGSFAALFRYRSKDNYAACNFSEGYTSLTERIDGREKIISEAWQEKLPAPGKELSVKSGAYVVGNKASCFLDGQKIIDGRIGSGSESGGIGFSVWNSGRNNDALTIEYLKVRKSPPSALAKN